jgi:hypothetical protein
MRKEALMKYLEGYPLYELNIPPCVLPKILSRILSALSCVIIFGTVEFGVGKLDSRETQHNLGLPEEGPGLEDM